MQRLRNFWKNSYTHAWAFCQYTTGGVLALAAFTNQVVTNVDFKTAIAGLGLPPWVPPALVILGVITYIMSEHKDA